MEVLALSGLAGLATCAGSCIALVTGGPGQYFLGWLLGLAAGVMFSVGATDLLPTAWEAGGAMALAVGSASSLACLVLLDRVWLRRRLPGRGGYLRLGYFIGTAIALHDLPEGMAIAVGFAARPELGLGLALAIGLHNLPEGMATAAPLLAGGLSPARILVLSVLLAAATPLGTGLGLAAVQTSAAAIAPLLAAAAAAMFYVVLAELLPAALKRPPWPALLGLALGLALGQAV